MGSERGIAMIWWVIVLLVLFLAASGLAFDRYSYGVDKEKEIEDLQEELKDAEKLTQAEIQKRVDLSHRSADPPRRAHLTPPADEQAVGRVERPFYHQCSFQYVLKDLIGHVLSMQMLH